MCVLILADAEEGKTIKILVPSEVDVVKHWLQDRKRSLYVCVLILVDSAARKT